MNRRAIFLDKDGTLIPDIPYNVDPRLITLSDRSVQGLKLLSSAGYLLVVVTNQSGIARGYFEAEKLPAVFDKITQLLSREKISIDAFYYCPHHPDGNVSKYAVTCNCRKPLPGMILQAVTELNIDVSDSWMIGDILNDVEAGNRAGCRTVLLDNGNETEWLMTPERTPSFKVKNIDDAARYIIEFSNHEHHEKKLAGL